MNIKLVYASLTGNTEMLSDLIIEKFEEQKDLQIEKLFIEDMVDFDFLDDADAFIVATYTYGEGDLPEEMEEFFEEIGQKDYSGKIYGVIGTGDTIYDEYCACVDQFNEQIAKTGATNPTEKLKLKLILTKILKILINSLKILLLHFNFINKKDYRYYDMYPFY